MSCRSDRSSRRSYTAIGADGAKRIALKGPIRTACLLLPPSWNSRYRYSCSAWVPRPDSAGTMEIPSMPSGIGRPASSAHVGSTSQNAATWSHVRPAGTAPGPPRNERPAHITHDTGPVHPLHRLPTLCARSYPAFSARADHAGPRPARPSLPGAASGAGPALPAAQSAPSPLHAAWPPSP